MPAPLTCKLVYNEVQHQSPSTAETFSSFSVNVVLDIIFQIFVIYFF